MTATPATDSPSSPRLDAPILTRNRGLVGLCATLATLLAVTAPVITTVILGAGAYEELNRGFPGLDVGVITSILLAGADIGCLVTVGALIYLLFLRDVPPKRAKRIEQVFEVRVLRAASGLWAACSGGLVIFRALDSNGMPLFRLAEPGAFAYFFESSYAPGAWTVSFIAALIVFFAAFFADWWTGLLIPLWASMFGMLAPVVTGQILVGPEHDFGSDAGVFQTLAVNIFFGAVVVLAIRVASGRLIPPETLRRLFIIGAVALPVIITTDLILAWFKLAGTGLTDSLTGWFILGRWVCLALFVIVIGSGWLLWRRARLREHHITWGLALGTLSIAGWIAITAAMTRQAPPQYFVPTSISQVFLGFEVADPPTLAVLFGHWRPNLLFLGLAIAAVSVYLVAVRVLHKRGDTWPVGRTIAWLLGWGVVVFITSSGFGKYSAPNFAVHMIVHMSLNMLAPGMLVLGGIITLLLRATRSRPNGTAGIHDWITWILQWKVLHFIYNPLLVFILFVGSYYGLYFSGIFGDFMRFHWAHQFMNLHFLIVGYLYYSLIIGVDRPPRPLPHIGKLGYVLAAMPFHAFFGIILMSSTTIIAENFYQYFGLTWSDLPALQYLGGGIAWAGGEIPLLIVVVILLVQWGRQDAKEARRKDRHLDTGRDDEFEAYNSMLQRLTSRQTAGPVPGSGPPASPQDGSAARTTTPPHDGTPSEKEPQP
ncbi:cytochrome c oxidase assembly protein [Lysinibacter sp. HNR]|uniref:cytochrome c oxidase assembly protein n=1 Tax=Lysinibacter sp. HNR TaxID=3031408 RepID=UPI0024353D92|nr:cytochrome c oxidase assembly protein [Lysinibacter sp. HNR]WGD36959.1 cytochrome c oxidase assembly protein [Lysinibacter sp. HNR]